MDEKNYTATITLFNSLKKIMDNVYLKSLSEFIRINEILNLKEPKNSPFFNAINSTPEGYDEYNSRIIINHEKLIKNIKDLISSLLKEIEDLKKTSSEKIVELNEMERICLEYKKKISQD